MGDERLYVKDQRESLYVGVLQWSLIYTFHIFDLVSQHLIG